MKIQTEQERILEVAKNYEDKGYNVLVAPKPNELPPPLSKTHYEVDLFATKNDEVVVMEIRKRGNLADVQDLQVLSQIVNGTKGWRFNLEIMAAELVTIKPTESFEANLEEISLAEALEEVEALLKVNCYSHALLQSWTALEIILRRLQRFESDLDRYNLSAIELAVTLTSLGYLVQEDYDMLLSIVEVRDALVHGYRPIGDFKKMTEQVVDLINKLASQSFD